MVFKVNSSVLQANGSEEKVYIVKLCQCVESQGH